MRIVNKLALACLLAPGFALAQAPVPFVANLSPFTGAASAQRAYIAAVLQNCNVSGQPVLPQVPGYSTAVVLLPPQYYMANSAGLVSSTIVPNGDIQCGATLGGTWYLLQVWSGLPTQPQCNTTVAAASCRQLLFADTYVVPGGGQTFNLATAQDMSGALIPGAVPSHLKGPWVSTATYVQWDIVTDLGSSYIALLTNLNQEPPNSNWQLLASIGATGTQGPQGIQGIQGVGVQGPQGVQGPNDFSANIYWPVVGDAGLIQHKLNEAVTVSRVSCSVDSGSVTVQLDIRSEAAPNTAGLNILAAPLVCTAATGVTTSFANPAVTADSPIAIDVLSTSGAPNVVRIHVAVNGS